MMIKKIPLNILQYSIMMSPSNILVLTNNIFLNFFLISFFDNISFMYITLK